MQGSVRPAESGDLPAITALYLDVADEVIPREPTFRRRPDASSVHRRYASRIDDAERAILVSVVDDGARMVTLDTHITNDAARALYTSMGYRQVGVILAKEIENG
jgi:ribosomal protein S18 acetylase RimI-like enzyme